MKELTFQEIIKQSFSITWKNKFLWIFGFFIFFGSATSSIDVYNGNFFEQIKTFSAVTIFIQKYPTVFIFMLISLLFFAIAFFLLKIIATVAIIKSVNDIKLYSQLSPWKIFIESKGKLPRLLLLEILISITLGVIITIMSLPIIHLFSLKAEIFGFLALVLAIAIFIPLILLAYYLKKYAYFYVILANYEIRHSLESAYALFLSNLKKSLLMGAVNIAMAFLFLISLSAIILAIFFVFSLMGFALSFLFASTATIIVSALGLIVLFIFLLLAFSFYGAFLQTTWFLFFQQLSFKKNKEKKTVLREKNEEIVPSPEAS